MPAFTTTTTIEALPPSLDCSTLQMGGARQRIRLMRSTMKLGRSASATAMVGQASSEPHTRSHSPAPSMSSMLTTTTKIEALPIGPKHNVVQGVTHRRSGSGGSVSSQGDRRKGSVFTGLHLTLVDDYASKNDDPTTYVHSKRGHGYTDSTSSSSTAYTTSSTLPPTRSFAAGRRSKDSQRASPRPKPLALEDRDHSNDENHANSQSHAQTHSKRQSRRQSTSEPHSESSSKSSTPMPTPLTPSFRFLAPAIPEMRELKLKKLAKQLGEQIPPELVFKPSHLNANASREGIITEDTKTDAPRDSGATNEWAGVEVKSRRRSISVDNSQHPTSHPQQSRTNGLLSFIPKSIAAGSKWEAPSSWLRGPSEPDVDESEEKEKAKWMGVWNAEDHDDVMKKLRALKK